MVLVPNLFTLSRLLVGLLLLLSPPGGWWLVALLAWGAISDGLDGLLARRLGVVTRFGAAFDLTTDGLFFLGAYAAVWRQGQLPTLWFCLILALVVPELIAQALLQRRGSGVGSPGRIWNRVLGGYSFVCVIAIACGVPATAPAAVHVALQAWANGMDLRLALSRSGS